MELWGTGAGRTYSREKSNRNSLGRRATVGRPEGGGQREGEIDYAPGRLPCAEKMLKGAGGEREAGCNGRDEVGGGGGASGQSRFSFGFSQPSK